MVSVTATRAKTGPAPGVLDSAASIGPPSQLGARALHDPKQGLAQEVTVGPHARGRLRVHGAATVRSTDRSFGSPPSRSRAATDGVLAWAHGRRGVDASAIAREMLRACGLDGRRDVGRAQGTRREVNHTGLPTQEVLPVTYRSGILRL